MVCGMRTERTTARSAASVTMPAIRREAPRRGWAMRCADSVRQGRRGRHLRSLTARQPLAGRALRGSTEDTVAAVSDDIPPAQAIEERQVADAWRRIQSWLSQYAPATVEALLPGASEAEIDALERELGVRVPAGLRGLWRHCSGVRPSPQGQFLLGAWAPMRFASVVRKYRTMLEMQQHEVEVGHSPGGAASEEFVLWRASWIPFCSDMDRLFGLCVDAETGKLWSWSKYADRAVEFESLSGYLEEMADVLEVPSLATGVKPGLMDGALVWGAPADSDERARWRPVAG